MSPQQTRMDVESIGHMLNGPLRKARGDNALLADQRQLDDLRREGAARGAAPPVEVIWLGPPSCRLAY
jgi:hypothetical protein